MGRGRPSGGVALLTFTEQRVLAAIAAGMHRHEAAASLRLSVHTVGHSLTVAREKLNARTVPEAAVIYARLTSTPPVSTPRGR